MNLGSLLGVALTYSLLACASNSTPSSTTGPTPIISNLTVTSTGASVSGQIDVMDTAGISDPILNVTINSPTLTVAIQSIEVGNTPGSPDPTWQQAAIPFLIELPHDTTYGASGTYTIIVTLKELGATSNALSAQFSFDEDAGAVEN
jgi:hypothetical protein